jgi:GNAT superfamily N-acetyltransferase
VGSSSYFLGPRTGLADVAYMVDPDWQGGGLGNVLQARTIEYARAHGVRGFTADVLLDNAAMLAVFRRSGCRVTSRSGDGVVELQLLFEEPMVKPSRAVKGPRSGGRELAPGAVERRSVSGTRRSRSARRRT